MSKRILYCVLNWGLGHASRSTPIIQRLIEEGNEVIIASDGLALDLLTKQFPNEKTIALPSYDIKYKFDSILLNILHQARKFIRAKKSENIAVSRIVKEQNIQEIISDNRFGCYHSTCSNIFMTHQIRLLHSNKVLSALGSRMNVGYIENFDKCWVPDYAGPENLSGEMSHKVQLKIPIEYIGIMSRFTKIDIKENPKYKTLTILSGPEPQRSKLEEAIVNQLEDIPGLHAIIRGKNIAFFTKGNLDFFGILDDNEITSLIKNSQNIISRSGYSSIMDYEAMGIKAILIPTPGQSEQIYLAENALKNRRHQIQFQDNIKLTELLY